MFGQDDKQDENVDSPTTIQPTDDDTETTNVPVTNTSDETDNGSTDDESTTDDSDDTAATDPEAEDKNELEDDTTPESLPTPVSGAVSTSSDDSLLDLKKAALGDLAPLIDHLDQTPEEHYKTTMMLIQATDNPEYVKTAYESAKKITDETVRAQALLDIVNEINYFTQKHASPSEE